MTAELDTGYDLVVVGAGPTGLVSALLAAQSGQRVVVLEKKSMHSIRGYAHYLNAYTLEILASVGVDMQVLLAGSASTEQALSMVPAFKDLLLISSSLMIQILCKHGIQLAVTTAVPMFHSCAYGKRFMIAASIKLLLFSGILKCTIVRNTTHQFVFRHANRIRSVNFHVLHRI